MNKIKYFMLVGLVMGSVATFAAKDSTFHFSNSVRVGHDNNIYLSENNQEETAYITDIAQISGKVVFSSRSDLLLFWQPEFRYRLDAEPKFVSYQDLYGKLSHAASQRVFLTLSDRFRFQDKEGQSDLGSTENQNFYENDLKGALDFTLTPLSQIKVGAGHEFRQWISDVHGKGTRNNNYNQYVADGSYVRELRPNTTHGMVGLNYLNNTFAGDRGGFDSTTAYGGVDHNFNANLLGNLQLGYTFGSVDGSGGSSDTSNPFLQSGLEYNPSDRTRLNASLGYALSRSQNSYYNASDDLKFSLGIRQELTGKISLSSVISYTLSNYDASYSSGYAGVSGDAEEHYLNFTLRGSYQINRNNFVDIGYGFSQRGQDKATAALSEYTRSQFDFGWRLKL